MVEDVMVYKKTSRTEEHKDERRKMIFQTAARVFAEKGYHQTTVKNITDAADISVGTFYIYFKNKDRVLDYIFETQHKKIIAFSEELEKNNIPPLDKIKKLLKFHFKELEDNLDLANKFNISTVPSILTIKEGKCVGRIVGLHNKKEITNLISVVN
jgi:AcrR family transcriptional regulator